MNGSTILLKAAAVAAATTLALSVSGCSEGGDESAEAQAAASTTCELYSSGVVLALSVHQNAPAPGLPTAIACRVEETIAAGLPVGMIAIDGEPWQAFAPTTFDVTGNSATESESKLSTAVAQVAGAAQAITARSDGADVFAGSVAASNAARSFTPAINDIVIIDSGASDRGVVAITDPGITIASPEDVAQSVLAKAGLGDDFYDGQTITLVSFGETADPQATPTVAQAAAIPQVWKATFEAFGAVVAIDATPRDGDGPDTVFTTGKFEVTERIPFEPGSIEPIVFDAGSALGFLPDSAEFRDPEAARDALRPLADWLNGAPGRSASITGTTASPSPELNGPLSLARAETVARILVSEFKVVPDALTTVGAGYTASPDDHPNGVIDPGLAALNMTVRVQMIEAH